MHRLLARPDVLNLLSVKPKKVEPKQDANLQIPKKSEIKILKKSQSLKIKPALPKKAADVINSHNNASSNTS